MTHSDPSFSIARNTRRPSAAGPAPTPPADTLTDPPEPLSLTFLLDIAEGLASVERLWQPHLHADRRERPATRLLAAGRWEAWLLEWDPGQSVEFHDHGPSAGAFQVVSGCLVELRAAAANRIQRREVDAGGTRCFSAGTRHDVLNVSNGPAASIHVYSPPLSKMTFFDPVTFAPIRTEPVDSPRPVLGGDHARLFHPSRLP
jgi:quercetin dioxygenase-like cupin family protein